MSELPVDLAPELRSELGRAFDPQGKIVRALAALGPVADRDVLVVDAEGGPVVDGLAAEGARLSHVGLAAPLLDGVADGSADVIVGLWSAFRGVDRREVAAVDRVLRPEGRQLVVLDYGRDDVSKLRGDRPEYGDWSRRGGAYLAGGFKVRVLHCFWEWDSLPSASAFLERAFGDAGASLATRLKRPRLTYNVAVYHRSRDGQRG